MSVLVELETFVAVIRAGGFAAAARQLGVSPAMVGRRIQALEDRYGARLIERTTRSQRLTEIGESFYARANDVLEAANELDELAGAALGPLTGRIRITGPTTLGIKQLAPSAASFLEQHPGVTLEMSLSDRRVDLVGEGFDMAIRIGELRASSMIARRLGTYHFVCCVAPAWLARNGTPESPLTLSGAQCVINLNLVPRNRWPFIGPDGVPQTVEVMGSGLEIDNGEAQRAAALSGAGIIYSPLDLVAEDIAEGRLVRLFDGWEMTTLPIHAVYPSRRLLPRRISAYVEHLAALLRPTL